jgi:GalNAc-alpha-(1->4)-GalNAc-alpha-(1->3)-diNAcBac-PP-undecaprenol alpha-1,4-N-acetyl-D-galactosaminyltransferase
VFLLTSRYEGFGNVLIEAMALAIPVVATASAGTRDIVDHDVDGLLVDSHTPQAVAAALRQVLDHRERRASMSRQAAASAERFATPRVAARYDLLLRQVDA